MPKRTLEQQLADHDKKRDEIVARMGARSQTERQKLTATLATAKASAKKANDRVTDIETKLADLDKAEADANAGAES